MINRLLLVDIDSAPSLINKLTILILKIRSKMSLNSKPGNYMIIKKICD